MYFSYIRRRVQTASTLQLRNKSTKGKINQIKDQEEIFKNQLVIRKPLLCLKHFSTLPKHRRGKMNSFLP